MLKAWVALRLGLPLSRTTTEIGYAPSAWLEGDAQVKTPVAGAMLAPAGAPGPRLKARRSVVSGSVAVAVRVSVSPAKMVWTARTLRTGESFTGVTVRQNVSMSEAPFRT